MTQEFQRFTKRYVNVLGVLIGLTVVSSILFYSGCGMTNSPNIRTNPTPTPTPAPTPTPDRSAPTSTITEPKEGAHVVAGGLLNFIRGTASDGGADLARVEVSFDGGTTYTPVPGNQCCGIWFIRWFTHPNFPGPVTIKSRAVGLSGKVQDPPAEVHAIVDVRPTSTITSPTTEANILIGTPVVITGTASDANPGSVVKVEVSVDGGRTYSVASGTDNWSFNWTPSAPGTVTILSRAIDDFGLQEAAHGIRVNVDIPPTSKITFPKEADTVTVLPPIDITGTAIDDNPGSVVKVEVSVDGGANYAAATGTNAWSFNWTPSAPGLVTIKSRAVDNTGNVQDPPDEIRVLVKEPTTFRVPTDEHPTIQSAINVATNGDRVLVAPGTYSENINFGGKAITVTSESGRPDDTIIDGRNANPVVSFTSQEGRYSVLNGFTLQNGGSNMGGGIKVENSSPRITNNMIKNNQACNGAGIGIHDGSPLIQLNTITSNVTAGGLNCLGGGGIRITGASSVEILDNVISDNSVSSFGYGGGIAMTASGTSIVKRNIIKGNDAGFKGGGIGVEGPALIVQNLIVGNQASNGAGIDLVIGPVLVNNNTIADNDASSTGSGIRTDTQTEMTNNIIVAKPRQTGLHCGNSNPNPSIIRFNNIFSSGGPAYGGICSEMTGTGNISADPLFTDPAQGDYHLQQGSPSIDRGDNETPNLPDKDLDGHPRILDGDGDGTATVDMGVYEFRALASFNISLQDERDGNMLKINSTNGQYLFTRWRGIPLIESRLKPAHTPRLYQLAAGKFDAGFSSIRYREGKTIRRHRARQSDRTLAPGAPPTSF